MLSLEDKKFSFKIFILLHIRPCRQGRQHHWPLSSSSPPRYAYDFYLLTVSWLNSRTFVRKVPGSNLSRDTDYSDSFFVAYLSPSRHVTSQYLNFNH